MALPPDMQAQQEQEEREAQQRRTQEFLRKREKEDFEVVLGTAHGRRLLFGLQRLFLLHTGIGPGPAAEYNLGLRHAALMLRGKIAEIEPELPARMELEWLQISEPAAHSA